MLLPENIGLARQASKCFRPARFLLIDGSTTIRTKHVWKAADLNFSEPIADRTIDDHSNPFHALFITDAGGLGQLVHQFLFLAFRSLALAHVLSDLLRLH